MRKIELSVETTKKLIADYCKITNKEINKKYGISDKVVYRIIKEQNKQLKGHKCTHNRVIQYIKKNSINTQILYGSLLGDGHVSRNSNKFSEKHKMEQENYLMWKNNRLRIKYGYVNEIKREYKSCVITGAGSDPWMIQLRKIFYPNGNRVFNKEILDNIDELGLLIWYLDCGNCSWGKYRSKKTGLINFYPCCRLFTKSFLNSEPLIMKKWFKDKWNININIRDRKNLGDGYYYIYFPVLEYHKLMSILRKTFKEYKLPKCMAYKLWR